MSMADGGLAYMGCSACKKGRLDGQPTCQCNKDTQAYWKANVLLTDNTAQVTATMFDVTAELEAFADLQGEPFNPSRFAEDKDAADNLMLSIAAMPFTMLIEFQDSEFVGGLALVVRKLAPTFLGQAGSPAEGVDHPYKAIPRFPCQSPSCPPALLAQTMFNKDAGLTLVDKQGVTCFRTVVQFVDRPKGAKPGENFATLKVERSCKCILAEDDDKTYDVVQNGPLEQTSQLLQVRTA